MITSTGFSLWLQPTGQTYDRLAGIIKQLGAQYHAPVFEPHITLLGGLTGSEDTLITRTTQLAKLLKPNAIKLTTLDYLDEYFRCLFANVEKSAWLIDANLKARKIFHRKDVPAFMPHLSLLYGNFPPAIKQRISIEIGSSFNFSFQVTSVQLWSTAGEPKAWFERQEFRFT